MWVIASVLLFGGSFWLLAHWYRKGKRLEKECQSFQSTLSTFEKTAAMITEQYQELTEDTKELFEEPVTQLPTYKIFSKRLQLAMVESQRYSFYLALCLIEIHNNQALVDEDRTQKELFLAECAQQLKVAIRKIDFLAHYESNTFILLLTGLNQPEKASFVAQRLFDLLTRPVFVPYARWNKTVSIGISVYPTDGETSEVMLANTMYALAVAKQKERSAYQFYEPALQIRSKREHALMSTINGANFFNQLRLNYFPIIDSVQNKLLALSAELQWQHPIFGVIPQSEWLVLAEKQTRLLGMMVWQLEKACLDFLAQRKEGCAASFLCISVPLLLLRNSRFVHGLQQWLIKWQFSPEWLWLQVYGDFNDITLEEFEKTANMLRYLRIQLGILQQNQQALPLSYLAQIPFTYYKLSDKMLTGMLDSSRVKITLRALSQFMNQLSIQLIVSDAGIAAQRDMLQQLGIVLIEQKQGIEVATTVKGEA